MKGENPQTVMAVGRYLLEAYIRMVCKDICTNG